MLGPPSINSISIAVIEALASTIIVVPAVLALSIAFLFKDMNDKGRSSEWLESLCLSFSTWKGHHDSSACAAFQLFDWEIAMREGLRSAKKTQSSPLSLALSNLAAKIYKY